MKEKNDFTNTIIINGPGEIPLANKPFDELVDRENGINWNILKGSSNTIYYSFSHAKDEKVVIPNENLTEESLLDFNDSQVAAVKAIFEHTSGITGINFVETKDIAIADFRFNAFLLQDINSKILFSHNIDDSKHIYLNNDDFSNAHTGTEAYTFLLRQIGSGLGLGLVNSLSFDSNENLKTINKIFDNALYTKFQQDDIKALQWIYGKDGLGGEGHYFTNSAPISSSNSINLKEDSVFKFKPNLFHFEDNDDVQDNLQGIKVINTTSKGNLVLNNHEVKNNQIIDIHDIKSGALKFIPLSNGYGNNYDKFTFSVSDGFNLSKHTYTMKINVANVIDNLILKGDSKNNTLAGDAIDNNSNDTLIGLLGDDILIGKGGKDKLIGGKGADKYFLSEKIAATDTIVIKHGESPIEKHDKSVGFGLTSKLINNSGSDKIDFNNTIVSSNVIRENGYDSGSIKSHHITNGLIKFDDQDRYNSAIKIDPKNLSDVINYLQKNLTQINETVAFHVENSTYIFQNNNLEDTLVELVGTIANGLSVDGVQTSSIWIV